MFVEYTCAGGGPRVDIWSQANYFTYVVSGEMTLSTFDHNYEISAGSCYLVRPGGFSIPTFLKDFCDLILFISDDFIREVVTKYQFELPHVDDAFSCEPVIELKLDDSLHGYYQSLASYFSQGIDPGPAMLKLKCEEFLINVLSNRENWQIASYCRQLCQREDRDLRQLMSENFNCPLSLSDFAKLSHRSLSTFRRDFYKTYGTTPAAWIKEQRLTFAAQLLRNTNQSLSEIIDRSGFKNRSHFTRAFKQRFKSPPSEYRLR